MASKFYLRNTQVNSHPTSGEKSTTEPVAASTFGLTPTDRDLMPAKGSTATTQVTACNSTTSAQNGCLGRWSSAPLVAGTYGSGTWTLAVQTIESNANADAKFASASIYFWRPSNNSVTGFVIDSNTQVGVEFGNNTTARYGQVLSLTGTNVTIADGDILVIEMWTNFTQVMAQAANLTVCYDGTTDVTSTYALTDPASYLQAPANIPQTVSTGGAIAGHGVLSGTGVRTRFGDATAVGQGVLAGAGVRTRLGSGTLVGHGVLSGSGVRTRATGGTIAGSGVLAGTGTRIRFGSGTLVGTGVLSGSGTVTAPDVGGDCQQLLEDGTDQLLEDGSQQLLEGCVTPIPPAATSSPGGKKYDPSRETRAYWDSEAERLDRRRTLLREDDEMLVMLV